MKNAIVLLVHSLAGLVILLGTGGTRAVLTENILLKKQLLVLQRSRRRAPNLRTADRVLFGFCAQFLSPRWLLRTAIILKPATLLRFHRGFKDCKYRFLYSSIPKQEPGQNGPSAELIRAIRELKQRNPRFGCLNHGLTVLAAQGFSTTKKPELDSGLSATFYTENKSKSPLDAAPQICACQPHTA